jgi:hypothetical protein
VSKVSRCPGGRPPFSGARGQSGCFLEKITRQPEKLSGGIRFGAGKAKNVEIIVARKNVFDIFRAPFDRNRCAAILDDKLLRRNADNQSTGP